MHASLLYRFVQCVPKHHEIFLLEAQTSPGASRPGDSKSYPRFAKDLATRIGWSQRMACLLDAARVAGSTRPYLDVRALAPAAPAAAARRRPLASAGAPSSRATRTASSDSFEAVDRAISTAVYKVHHVVREFSREFSQPLHYIRLIVTVGQDKESMLP
jgi:hypothetical protein